MKKSILIVVSILIGFTFAGCTNTPPNYERKDDGNPEYYNEYVIENNIESISLDGSLYGSYDFSYDNDDMNDLYEMYDMDEESSSFFVYHTIGINEEGKRVHVFMPDKLGESNMIVLDHLPLYEQLETHMNVDEEVMLETSNEEESNINLMDVTINETSDIAATSIARFYTNQTVNGVELDVDKEGIRSLLFEYLSSIVVYRIGSVTDDTGNGWIIYLGKGIETDLVYLAFDSDSASLQVIGEFDITITDMSSACLIPFTLDMETLDLIDGYSIKRTQGVCDMYLGRVIIDGYDFGIISSGCDWTIDNVGYYAEKDGETYTISSLIENGIVTVEDIYNIYICDVGRTGYYPDDTE